MSRAQRTNIYRTFSYISTYASALLYDGRKTAFGLSMSDVINVPSYISHCLDRHHAGIVGYSSSWSTESPAFHRLQDRQVQEEGIGPLTAKKVISKWARSDHIEVRKMHIWRTTSFISEPKRTDLKRLLPRSLNNGYLVLSEPAMYSESICSGKIPGGCVLGSLFCGWQ